MMIVVTKTMWNSPDSPPCAITLFAQPLQVLHDEPDRRFVELTAFLVEPYRHDDAWLDLRRVRHPLEQPVRIARGLERLQLVVERALDAVAAEVRRGRHRARLVRIEAVARRAVLLRDVGAGERGGRRPGIGSRVRALEMRPDREDVRPVVVGAVKDERDQLAHLLGVERPAVALAPRRHRELRRHVGLPPRDAQADVVLGLLELGRVVLERHVLEVGLVERLARQRFPILAGLAVAEAQLPVAVEAEVRVEILSTMDRRLELLLRADRAQVRGAGDDLQQEVTADQADEREEHRATRDDLAVEVARDLERVRRGRDRRDPVRRRLLHGVPWRVVLLQQLDAVHRLLLGFDLLLVIDDVAEVRDEGDEEEDARHREKDVGVHQASATSACAGFHSLLSRRITFSGFVSTTSAPFTSLMWNRSSPRGAGPPILTAVSLS